MMRKIFCVLVRGRFLQPFGKILGAILGSQADHELTMLIDIIRQGKGASLETSPNRNCSEVRGGGVPVSWPRKKLDCTTGPLSRLHFGSM